MENELIKKAEGQMTFGQMKEQAEYLIKSGFLPQSIKTPEQAIAVAQMGKELGLGMMQSFTNINVIQGRPALSAQLMIALCRKTGECEQAYPKEVTPTKAIFILQRKGQPAFESVFTREAADHAKFSMAFNRDKQEWYVKDNWQKQPATMLLWRAISQACRYIFPDAVTGVYTEDELADDVILSVPKNGAEPVVTEVVQEKKTPAELPLAPKEAEAAKHGTPDDQLGNFVVKIGKYNGRTLAFIAGDETPTGDKKGLKWLNTIAAGGFGNSIDEETRDVVRRFLNKLKS